MADQSACLSHGGRGVNANESGLTADGHPLRTADAPVTSARMSGAARPCLPRPEPFDPMNRNSTGR